MKLELIESIAPADWDAAIARPAAQKHILCPVSLLNAL